MRDRYREIQSQLDRRGDTKRVRHAEKGRQIHYTDREKQIETTCRDGEKGRET